MKKYHCTLKQKFTSTENLYCVVTEISHTPERLNFALQHLTNRGYKASCRKIGKGWYVIREFLDSEYADIQFINVFGEIIEGNDNGEWKFNTQNKEDTNVTGTASN